MNATCASSKRACAVGGSEMALVPSNQLRDAWASLSRDGYDGVSFGRAWRLTQTEMPSELAKGARPTYMLEHYGTVVMRTRGDSPTYVRVTSASDRDGVNGLLRLMGVGARWEVHRSHDLAILTDRATGRTGVVSEGVEMGE